MREGERGEGTDGESKKSGDREGKENMEETLMGKKRVRVK